MDMLHKAKTFSLITGASSGIGKAIALECARRSMNIILVALDDDILKKTTVEIHMAFPDIRVLTLPVDLSEESSARFIHDYCKTNKLTVNMLINNAAIGSSGRFDSHTESFHSYAVKVNLLTPLLLTRLFIPDLMKQQKAYILNVSSSAAFFDMPFKTIYSATKTFVYSFTRSVREELRDSNVKVSVMCSGGVVTNAETRKRCEELGYISRKLQLSAERVAADAVKGLLEGKRLIMPGFSSKLFFIVSKILPYRLKLLVLRKFYGKVYNHKENEPILSRQLAPITMDDPKVLLQKADS
jgi:short-subunit dehydrogenase